MAESLLYGVAQGVLGKIASAAFQEAVAICSVEDQIRELGETLTTVKAVLSDAEVQKAKDGRRQRWLDRLQHVFYDAEDVLDELECGALRKKVHGLFSLSNPLVFRVKISLKIKKIRERLSKICTEKDRFGLDTRSTDNGGGHTSSRKMSDSLLNKKLDLTGRDNDKETIIGMLMHPDDKNLSVLPIVGIGGMGKTALARLVYNDDRVKERFELRLWVCVPEDFDLEKTIKGIIKRARRQDLSNFGIQRSPHSLQDIIKDRKFLLVLDGVWRNDRSGWKDLRNLLVGGASGSTIIVTTRDVEVASYMRTHPVHILKRLSRKDSMTLFKTWAFDEKEKKPPADLLRIGKGIVKKSQGVPLLVKALGSLLYSKDDVRHWKHTRDSDIWELTDVKKDVAPVLKLSYDHLPPHLKRCFATLSLFPRGHRIKSLEIARLWMALGFISSTTDKLALEDVADEYVKELWKRSLIQELEDDGWVTVFKVHDLIHSLATSVAQEDCSIVGLDTTDISEGVRCVSFSSTSLDGTSNFNGVPPFLRKPTSKRLRAIKFLFEVDDGVITREFAKTCISKCKHLRYLDLSYGSFEEIPSSIGNLKQLRSLRLSENKRLKKLPGTICELQSLLELFLHGCVELGDLPKNMERLVSLRHLYITTKQTSLQESGIQYLENLRILGLDRCENLQVLFEGTCQLTRLTGMEIENCGRSISLPFRELTALEYLYIANSKLTLTSENKSNFPMKLRALSISNSKQVMKLLGCLKRSACTLESFTIYDCPRFTTVPKWLPNHTRLRTIYLIRCPNLSSMPRGIRSLTALKELCIEDCGELSKRCKPRTGKDWHKIAHVPRIRLALKNVQWMYD